MTRREMVRRLFELDEEAQEMPGDSRSWDALMDEHDSVSAWIDTEYGENTCERLSWYCTKGRFSLEDLYRWVDHDWYDLNEFLEGDGRSAEF